MDEKNDQIAHRRIVAGREILRNDERNSNSPETAAQRKLKGLVELKLDGRTLVLERHQAAIEKSLELAGCYVVTTDVLKPNMSAQEVHDSYVSLQKVERDFRAMKTGLLEVRPLFLRKESRTRGHVFCCMLALNLSREMERRLQNQFGTTDSNSHAITVPVAVQDRRKNDRDETTTAECQPDQDPSGSGRDPASKDVDRRFRSRKDNNRNQINFLTVNS